jgi:hypothetical protein
VNEWRWMAGRGVLLALALAIMAGMIVSSLGEAQIGQVAHGPDATPNAAPVIPTGSPPPAPPPNVPAPTVLTVVAPLLEAATVSPARPSHPDVMSMRATFEALPAATRTAIVEDLARRYTGVPATPTFGPSPTRAVYPTPDYIRPAGSGRLVSTRDFKVPLPQGIDVAPEQYWGKDLDTGRGLTVLIGSDRATGTQGMIAVFSHEGSAWRDLSPVEYYPMPIPSGPVHVVAATGDQLTLVSTEGLTFTFDVGTRAFTIGEQPLGTASATPSPLPSITPVASPAATATPTAVATAAPAVTATATTAPTLTPTLVPTPTRVPTAAPPPSPPATNLMLPTLVVTASATTLLPTATATPGVGLPATAVATGVSAP